MPGFFVILTYMKKIFLLIFGLIIILGSFFLYSKQSVKEESNIKKVKINNVSIDVDIANTPETRATGLSGRTSLPEGTGMLFIFEESGDYGFWMKNMNFSIDIVWIDSDLRVVGVEKSVSPDTFPQSFHPKQAVKYVLELPARFSDILGVDIGTIMYFET